MSIPFNLNYPIERARADVQKTNIKTNIKQALEEVFGDQLKRIETAVGKGGGGGGGDTGGRGKRPQRTIKRLTKEKQEAIDLAKLHLDQLNALLSTQGGASASDLADAKQKLAEALRNLQTCEGKRNDSAQKILNMKALVNEVTRKKPSQDTIDGLKQSLIDEGEDRFADRIDNLYTAIEGCKVQLEELQSLQTTGSADPQREAEISGLRQKIANLEQTARQAGADCDKRLDSLKKGHKSTVLDLQQQLDECRKQVEGLPTGEAVKALETKLAACKESVKKYRHQVAKLQSLELQGSEKCGALEGEKKLLNEQIDSMKAEATRIENEVKNQREEAEKQATRAQKKAVEAQKSASEAEAVEQIKKLLAAKAEAHKAELKEKEGVSAASIARATAEAEQARKEADEAKALTRAAQQEAADAKKQASDCQEKLDSLNQNAGTGGGTGGASGGASGGGGGGGGGGGTGAGTGSGGGGGGGSGGGGGDGGGGGGGSGGGGGGAGVGGDESGLSIEDILADSDWLQTFMNAVTPKYNQDGKFTHGPGKGTLKTHVVSKLGFVGSKDMVNLGNLLSDKTPSADEPSRKKEQRVKYHQQNFATKTARNITLYRNTPQAKTVNLTNTKAFRIFLGIRSRIVAPGGSLLITRNENARLFSMIVGYFGLITPKSDGVDKQVHLEPNESGQFTRELLSKASFDLSNLFVWM
ncbi:unnamed protein product [Ectocarpus sp. 8 AP-2014]